MAGRGRTSKLLAIDWDVRTLRIVHAGLSKRGASVDRILSSAIPSDVDVNDPSQLGAYIRRVLDQEDISTSRAIVDIPRDQAILNTLTLPFSAPEELPGMVEIQIAKELPFPLPEAVVDFTIGRREEGSVTSDVLVAAVRKEVVQQYEQTFSAAGLKLDRIGLRPYANVIAVRELLRHSMPQRVMFIDVRKSLTEIDVVRDGYLVFSRAASVPIPDQLDSVPRLSLAQPSDESQIEESQDEVVSQVDQEFPASVSGGGMREVVGALVMEVSRSIEAYRARDAGAKIDHVVIGGDLGVEESLAEAIQQRLDIPGELYNPASSFGWEPDEGVAAVAFAATLGLVLGQRDSETVHFDFLHPKKTVSLAKERLRKAPLVAAVIGMFFLAAGVVFAKVTAPDRMKLASTNEMIADLKKDGTAKRKFVKLVEDIREFDSEQHVWIDVLFDIITTIPSNEFLVIDKIDMDQKGHRVVLRTRCKKRDVPTDTIKALEAFRREGSEKQRFKATMGAQTEKARDQYRFKQEIRIDILDDLGPARRSDKKSRGG